MIPTRDFFFKKKVERQILHQNRPGCKCLQYRRRTQGGSHGQEPLVGFFRRPPEQETLFNGDLQTEESLVPAQDLYTNYLFCGVFAS